MSSRAATLLPLLSTREKVGQLNQRLLGWRAVRRAPGSGFEVTEETLEEIETHGGLGALYGTFRADAWSGRHWGNGIRPEERAEVADLVQRTVAEHSPHGIGVLLSEEAPHGHQALGGTLLPTHHTSAASWDPDLVQEAYRAVGAELAASGVHLALVSALDMLRDPRWGRSEESFGEDPHLASVLTEALVTGMQAEGVAAVLKHLAAQGEGIGGRNGHSAPIGPNDLAEIHLPPVLAGLQAGALGFMAAYNDIDAVPCCANPWLLQEFLRDQHGFDGLVMADMGAIDRLAEMTGDLSSAGRAALLAGVDLSLCDRSYVDLGALAEEDPQVMTALDASCLRVLEMKDRFGLLGPTGEDGATDGSVGPGHPGVDPVDLAPLQAATARASRELAAASLVLLSNESAGGDGSADTSPAPVLPLDAASLKHLAVVGPFADDVPCMLGDYVPPLPDGSARSIGRALADTLPQAEVMVDGVATPEWLTGVESPLTGADAVVVVLGGTSHRSFEDEFADNGAIAGAAGQATNGEGVDRVRTRWTRTI
jgi:beta-glucosidase